MSRPRAGWIGPWYDPRNVRRDASVFPLWMTAVAFCAHDLRPLLNRLLRRPTNRR